MGSCHGINVRWGQELFNQEAPNLFTESLSGRPGLIHPGPRWKWLPFRAISSSSFQWVRPEINPMRI